MNICDWNQRRVTPDTGTAIPKESSTPPLLSRVNGWSLPLNVLQGMAWVTFLVMTLANFGIFIPLLPGMWRPLVYGVTSGLFLFHLVVHIIAISTDPAEPNVRMKKYSKAMPTFDRSKHAHVIQNQYCHLCEVTVSPKAKHCSACNKCIADFDHHCMWLNNCVGSRNYWCFFSSVASAVLALFCLAAVLLYIFIQYIMDQEELRSDPHFENITEENTWLLFLPFFPVRTTAPVLLIIGAAVLVMDLISLLMLGHLLLFHLYLLFRRLSTFDYITQGQQLSWKNSKKRETPLPVKEGVLQNADDQHKETTECVTEKDVDNGDTVVGVDSSSVARSFNLEAFSSMEIPPGNSALESLMLLHSLNQDISSTTSQKQLSPPQNRHSSMPTITSESSKEDKEEPEQVIQEVHSLQNELRSEGHEEVSPGRASRTQGRTSPDRPPALSPEPGSPTGETT